MSDKGSGAATGGGALYGLGIFGAEYSLETGVVEFLDY